VLVASDHGFGGTGNKAVYLNRWLAQLGLQRRHKRVGSQLSARLKCAALQCVPAHLQAQLFRLQHGRWANWLESRSRFAGIDWTGTRAFSEELNYFPSVWLNLKGREPQGVVERADYRRVADDICAAAETLRDPEHGRPVVRRAWRREELYDGHWTEYAPDVILEFNCDGAYSYRCLSSASGRTPEAIQVLGASESTGGKLAGMSGSHRPEGIFLVSAQDLGPARGGQRGAAIADMAPTILRLCGVDPPVGLDGRVVDGIPPPRFETETPKASAPVSEHPYDPAEEYEISARLAALGYLE
jgi:predicted AlkP superfamily phosphohydrolase/phosphomutase